MSERLWGSTKESIFKVQSREQQRAAHSGPFWLNMQHPAAVSGPAPVPQNQDSLSCAEGVAAHARVLRHLPKLSSPPLDTWRDLELNKGLI